MDEKTPALRQSASTRKSTGSKDAKSLRGNHNRDLTPPPMPDMSDGPSMATVDGPDDETLRHCTELRRQGKTLPQLAEALGLSLNTLHAWREERPEFFERTAQGFDNWVEQKAEEVLQLVDQLSKVRGLKPPERVTAMKHQIDVRLRVAAARLSEWGKDATGERQLIVIDAGLGDGPIKRFGLPGSPDGQNIAALKVGRWRLPAKDGEEGAFPGKPS